MRKSNILTHVNKSTKNFADIEKISLKTYLIPIIIDNFVT